MVKLNSMVWLSVYVAMLGTIVTAWALSL